MRSSTIKKRHKVCALCGVEFCDVTPRNVGRTCSKAHGIALGVLTRKRRGSYRVTPEQSAKQIATIKERYGGFSVLQTDESRRKISAALKQAYATGVPQSKSRQTMLEKHGVEHWTQAAAGRKLLSNRRLGVRPTPETRRKMSESAGLRVRSKRETLHTSARGGFRDDLGQYFRSAWEANYARILDHLGHTWSYEPQTFELGEGSYTPDFWVEDTKSYVEVKGRVSESTMAKFLAFRRQYPDVSVLFVGPKEYSELRKMYKSVVQWEGR